MLLNFDQASMPSGFSSMTFGCKGPQKRMAVKDMSNRETTAPFTRDQRKASGFYVAFAAMEIPA